MITGIHHISMKCASEGELQRVKDFYIDTLGFRICREWPEGIMIDAGNALLEILANGEGIKEKGAIRHIAFAADDVDAIVAKVKKAGYKVFIEPTDKEIATNPPFSFRMAFCFGPLGEEIEFFRESRGNML